MSVLSFWYGFDVGALSSARQFELWADLRQVKAQHAIQYKLYDVGDDQAVRQLHEAAGHDEESSQAAETAALWAQVRRVTE